jgi:hypothetical protein
MVLLFICGLQLNENFLLIDFNILLSCFTLRPQSLHLAFGIHFYSFLFHNVLLWFACFFSLSSPDILCQAWIFRFNKPNSFKDMI